MSEHHDINYKKIYFTLLILLVVSVSGPFVGIKWVTLVTAFGIAVVKANLVIQNFMHLRSERPIITWMLGTSVVLMLLFFFGVAPDVMSHEGQRWVNVAAHEAVARGISDEEHGEEAEHAAEEGAEEDHAEDEETQVAAADPGAVQVDPDFDAAGAYAAVCSSCHGVAGAGDGPVAGALDPKPADFTDPAFWEARDDDRVLTAILKGGAAVGASPLMAPWEALYDEAQGRALVEYLKTFPR
jgi:caa(3)-type oxidase subunit IV